MAFFKTKQEREIIKKMEQDEQQEQMNDVMNQLKESRTSYAKLAAEAELNGDTEGYNTAVNGLLDVNDNISVLTRAKMDFDIISLNDSICVCMARAMNILDKMAGNRNAMPNIRKIQKTQQKLNKYMRDTRVAQKAMSGAMKRSNPANKTRTAEELASVRPLIELERSKLLPSAGDFSVDLAKEIEKEKNKII